MRLVLCLTILFVLVAKDTWGNKIVKSTDRGIQLSSSNSESKDAASIQSFLSDAQHQVGKIRNIFSAVNHLKDAFHKHGVPVGGKASNKGQEKRMLGKVKHVKNAMGKAVQKFAGDQSYLGRFESPDFPEMGTDEEENDRIPGKLRRQHSKLGKRGTIKRRKRMKANSMKALQMPAHMYKNMYKKMIQYCSKLHKRMNDKRKDYYTTKGCRNPRKCKSYTKIHHITRDYESVTYRSSSASRFCSKFLPKLNANED